jgi:hypothetical protein
MPNSPGNHIIIPASRQQITDCHISVEKRLFGRPANHAPKNAAGIGRINRILLVPAALFFFGAGMLFPLATSGAMEPFPFLAGTAGALVGGLQNIGSGVLAWLSAMMPQTGQSSLGLLMMLMGLLILLCWLPLGHQHYYVTTLPGRQWPKIDAFIEWLHSLT